MFACICGGLIEFLIFVSAIGISGVVGTLVGKYNKRKCCNHECKNSNA